jgi:CDP-glycerol glycerophosphotransferase
MGRYYSCSPKAIYEAMIRDDRYNDFNFVWAFKNSSEKEFILNNRNTTIVEYASREYHKTYAMAKYWISNSRIPDHIKKRTDQIYIQTWHGTPLKKLGFDINLKGKNAMNSVIEIQKKYLIDARRYIIFAFTF